MNDLHKLDYEKYGNLLDNKGKLKEDTVYAIPVEDKVTLSSNGKKQVEVFKVTFEKGTHIEDVRRAMNKWADGQFNLDNRGLWIHLGYYELLPDGVFRQMVQVKDKLR